MREAWVLFLQRSTDSSIADDVEDTLFKSILRNAQHVLQPYLEERPQLHYNLRNRPGINKSLIEKTVNLNDREFSVRNLLSQLLNPQLHLHNNYCVYYIF